MSRPIPVNKSLYAQTKRSAKQRFKVWPSARASQWLVKEYKRKGGRYKGKKPSPKSGGLSRWQAEKWIDVCKLPKKVPCGRPKSGGLNKWKQQYPYCRPSKRISAKTPKLASELTKAQIASRCRRKKADPSRRITGSKRSSSRKRSTRKRSSSRKRSTRKRSSSRKRSTRKRSSSRKRSTRKQSRNDRRGSRKTSRKKPRSTPRRRSSSGRKRSKRSPRRRRSRK